MTEEAVTNLAFDNLRKGARIQVDINHPRIAALVNAGYLRIIWKEHDAQVAGVDDGAERLRSDGDVHLVGSSQAGTSSGEEVSSSGKGKRGSGKNAAVRPPADEAAGTQDS